MFWNGRGDGETVVYAQSPQPTSAVIRQNRAAEDQRRQENTARWATGIGVGLSSLGTGLMGAFAPPPPPAAPTAGTILLLGGAGLAVGLAVAWVARG
jgi:hypothetical protein